MRKKGYANGRTYGVSSVFRMGAGGKCCECDEMGYFGWRGLQLRIIQANQFDQRRSQERFMLEVRTRGDDWAVVVGVSGDGEMND